VADIEAAVKQLEARRPDLIVSVGGGSPIDAAKIVAVELGRGRDDGRRVAHLAIPTTLSVAELAAGAGMTDAGGDKVGRREAGMLPDGVIYDGELALHTPMQLWLSTGIRALDHAVEGYLASGEHPFSDVLAADAIRRLFDSLPRAREAPMDAGIRTENQLGAWFGFTLPGPAAAGLSHVMGKQIGARHRIPHGVTSCLLLPHVLRYRARREGDRIDSLARAGGLGENAEGAAAAIGDFIQRLDLPHHLAQFALTESDIARAAQGVGHDYPVEDLIQIYHAAW
jgi:alcohol dehydrogenase class IV